MTATRCLVWCGCGSGRGMSWSEAGLGCLVWRVELVQVLIVFWLLWSNVDELTAFTSTVLYT
ncbi:hypothetical protein E2C01_002339 [Portunus trituberculatus]|uniref:Uncharacterized protein n=1 Tax=Portunus trituberculatus TaxID=210409 RepID=A0A5B7CK45_PORTR|nr:hypothetical protein [Portunus trituberculatus]